MNIQNIYFRTQSGKKYKYLLYENYLKHVFENTNTINLKNIKEKKR